jgi:hypothetical protein
MTLLALLLMIPCPGPGVTGDPGDARPGLPGTLADGDGAPPVTVGLRGWYAIPSGWLFITSGSEPGSATRMTVDDEFDPEPTVAPELDARVRVWGPHAVGVRVTYLALTGTGSDATPFIFHGVTFEPGRRVKTDLSFLLVDVDYQLTFAPSEDLRVTGHVGAEIWDFSAELRTVDSLPEIDTKRAFGSGFWLLGADAAYRLSEAFEGRIFLAGGFERTHQYVAEAEALGVFHPLSRLGLTLGYRFQEIAFRQSTNRSNLRFSGPILGAEASF